VGSAGSFTTATGGATAQYGWSRTLFGITGSAAHTDRYPDPRVEENFTNTGEGSNAAVQFEHEFSDTDRLYEIASAGSQHVRLAGMVRSIQSSGGDLRLPDQDVDPESPFNFHLTIAHFHKTQGRIIAAFAKLLPDVADNNWAQLWNPFATRINELWAALEKTYADEMAESGGEPEDA
jgi:hypothetical protein